MLAMMVLVRQIVMAGRAPKHIEKNHRNNITDILSKHSIDELIIDISEEEIKDLLYDMSLLNLRDEKLINRQSNLD